MDTDKQAKRVDSYKDARFGVQSLLGPSEVQIILVLNKQKQVFVVVRNSWKKYINGIIQIQSKNLVRGRDKFRRRERTEVHYVHRRSFHFQNS